MKEGMELYSAGGGLNWLDNCEVGSRVIFSRSTHTYYISAIQLFRLFLSNLGIHVQSYNLTVNCCYFGDTCLEFHRNNICIEVVYVLCNS